MSQNISNVLMSYGRKILGKNLIYGLIKGKIKNESDI